MQAEPSQQQQHPALAVGSVAPAQSSSPYLASAPAGLFAPPSQPAIFDPAAQGQHQHIQHHHQPPPLPPPSGFVTADGSFQHPSAHNFQPVVQDPSSSAHQAAFRVPNVPRSAPVIDYSNPYQQLDPHLPVHQQHYSPHLYASTSYSALTGPAPVHSFGPDLSPHGYTHSELGMLPPGVGIPMIRYGFALSAEEMSRAGSSNGTPGPMTQQDIDNLLAMSRAQAGNHSDASAFPCTYCDKVYTGKHARSIWRRHLQDKHNIPLSAQPRRTRWDGDVNRPKNAEERRARMLESKRRWARKKRLQEKQAAQADKSGASNTPFPDGSDDDNDDGDDGADADVSSMSFSFSRTDADQSLPLKHDWDTEANFFSSQDKRQALAPSTAHNIAGPSSLAAASGSTVRRPALAIAAASQDGSAPPALANPNDSFSSTSSEHSQPGSASFFQDSFAGNMSNSGSETANTSIDTPATTWPALPPVDGVSGKAVDGAAVAEALSSAQPRAPKGDTRDAAIQLLALRSGSNSPTDDREMSIKRRDASGDAPWTSTPSKKAALHHATLTALSQSTADKVGVMEDVGLSPSPISKSLAAGGAVRVMPLTTPGPSTRTAENPFSLDKHKISPYEGRRKLSYGGAGSPIASPTHLSYGATGMSKSLSATSAGGLGVKLPPLVSTPIRPSSQQDEAAAGAERIKVDSLPALLGSASKMALGGAAVGLPLMSTPFSKPSMGGLGYSAMRRAGAGGSVNPHASVRPSPSRHHSDDQFSSPQHLNLTESLGLAPHSMSRNTHTPYASGCYASSLGLTPSVASIPYNLLSGAGGGGGGTPFHSLSAFGGFTPLSTAKVGNGAMTYWPDSGRKAAGVGSMLAASTPIVFHSSQGSTSGVGGASVRSGGSGSKSAAKRKRRSPQAGSASPGDIFDADYCKDSENTSGAGVSSDDLFGDDDDEENLGLHGALDTPSRPAAIRKLARTASGGSHKLARGSPGNKEQRSPLGGIRIN